MVVLDSHLGPCTTHAGAGLQLLQDFVCKLATCLQLLSGVGQCLQLVGAIEGSSGHRRLGRQTKAQVAGPIVRTIEQVVNLGDIHFWQAQLGLDDPTTPGIRARVTQRTGNTFELGDRQRPITQRQVVRIQRRGIWARQIRGHGRRWTPLRSRSERRKPPTQKCQAAG